MKTDDLKNAYQNRRAPKMNGHAARTNPDAVNAIIRRIKKQDRKDEKRIIKQRIIPLFHDIDLLVLSLLHYKYPHPGTFQKKTLISYILNLALTQN